MKIACYAQKSNDFKNDSIENQFSIIMDYISHQKDMQNAEILRFSDNGATGLNINRNAFQELGSIFPFMKVRLIAVSEHYDSKYRKINSMDLSSAFKAVLNEYYVLESSKKVRNSCI